MRARRGLSASAARPTLSFMPRGLVRGGWLRDTRRLRAHHASSFLDPFQTCSKFEGGSSPSPSPPPFPRGNYGMRGDYPSCVDSITTVRSFLPSFDQVQGFDVRVTWACTLRPHLALRHPHRGRREIAPETPPTKGDNVRSWRHVRKMTPAFAFSARDRARLPPLR